MKWVYRVSVLALVPLYGLFSGSPVHAAYLSLEPAAETVAPNASFQVRLNINTEGEKVVSADAVMNYDPLRLEVVNIIDGDGQNKFFPEVFKRVRPEKSEIYIAPAFFNRQDGRAGQGTIATITFRAAALGQTQVNFDCTPGVSSDSNITKWVSGTTYEDIIDCTKNIPGYYQVVQAPGFTPTPTPTITPGGPTLTPTLTITPTITPGGPTLTPTPTITPGGPTLTPTPTITPGGPTLTPSPTITPGGPTLTPAPTRAPTPTRLPEGGAVSATALVVLLALTAVALGAVWVIGW